VFKLAGSIAQDTQKMSSWGLGDVIQTVLENEKEKEEHEREMEKLQQEEKINYAKQNQTVNNTSEGSFLQNDLVKYGGVLILAVLIYKQIK
jgi:hypothetical protein